MSSMFDDRRASFLDGRNDWCVARFRTTRLCCVTDVSPLNRQLSGLNESSGCCYGSYTTAVGSEGYWLVFDPPISSPHLPRRNSASTPFSLNTIKSFLTGDGPKYILISSKRILCQDPFAN